MADSSSSADDKRLHEYFADFFQSTYLTLKKSALMKSERKAAIYWLIVVMGSFIQQFCPLPRSYLSYRRNVFNVYFVKIGWGWTWSLLSVISILCTSILTSGNIIQVMRHYSRLLVATLCWFCCVKFFEYIEHLTGSCTGEMSLKSKLDCHRKGFFWEGFDISAHAFLLIHCSLTISEEIQVVRVLEEKVTKSYNQRPSAKETLSFHANHWYKLLWPLIHVAFVVTAFLIVLWEFMLVVTSIYFHTVQQKLLGTIFALITWSFTYNYLYKMDLNVISENLK